MIINLKKGGRRLVPLPLPNNALVTSCMQRKKGRPGQKPRKPPKKNQHRQPGRPTKRQKNTHASADEKKQKKTQGWVGTLVKEKMKTNGSRS